MGLEYIGIDFSGAADAGKKICIAIGSPEGGVLTIRECLRAEELPGASRRRDEALKALYAFIQDRHASVIGIDFPFALPKILMDVENWETFILTFKARYSDPCSFRKHCWIAASQKELKRRTDCETGTPFSAYNLRLYKQTYFGVRDVLGPLVGGGLARVVPMQAPEEGRPQLLEICPASTLKSLGLYTGYGYKGRTEPCRLNRQRILGTLEQQHGLYMGSNDLRSRILDDSSGDYLDSVVAAFATFQSRRLSADAAIVQDPLYLFEGYVYV